MHPQNVIPEEDQPEMVERLAKGNFTMRTMYEQFQNLTKMGPMSQASTPLGPARKPGCLPCYSIIHPHTHTSTYACPIIQGLSGPQLYLCRSSSR